MPNNSNEWNVDQAVKRFLDNDPYYPRPATESAGECLWLHFQQRYLAASRQILDGSQHSDLPFLFIEKLKEAMTARLERKDIWSEFERQENA